MAAVCIIYINILCIAIQYHEVHNYMEDIIK